MNDNQDIFGRPLGGNPAKMNTFLRFNEPKTARQLEKESGCPNGKGHMDALVGNGVKSAGYGKGYVIDREWFDRQPEDKRLSFLANSGLSLAVALVENPTGTKEPQFWCVNFDSEDCLNHGLKHDLWMMQYQFADEQGHEFQSYKPGAIRNNWHQMQRVKVGDWFVAYLKKNRFFAVGKVRAPRPVQTAKDVTSRVDDYLAGEESHKNQNRIVFYADAPAFYEDFKDRWRFPQDKLTRYAQRIDVEEWQFVIRGGLEISGLGKFKKKQPYMAVTEIDEPFFRGLEKQLKKARTSFKSAAEDHFAGPDEAVVEALEKSHARSQGFQLDSELRKALELYAMDAAIRKFEAAGYEVEDHSKNQPYDLCCRRKKDVLYVEVKGTQTTGTGVILTSGEVEFARRHQENMALFVLHSIKVSRSRNLSDGTESLIMPWDVDHGSLKPMSYKYELP